MSAVFEAVFRLAFAETGIPGFAPVHSGINMPEIMGGPTGIGNAPANFPRISGQHAPYVEKALKDFRTGARSNDVSSMMRGVAAKMTDAEIAAVAQYVQGLH